MTPIPNCLPADCTKRFKALFDAAPLGVYSINSQGVIDSFNPEMLRLSGAAKAEDVLGLNVFDLASYKEVGLTDYFRRGLEGEEFYIPIVKYRSYTGGKVSYRSYRGVPIFNDAGAVEHLLCMVLDITEKVEIEEARRHATRLATIVEQSPDAIIVVAPTDERTIDYWNIGAEKMFGWQSSEAVGKPLMDILVPPDLREETAAFLKRLETETVIHSEVSRLHKDGHVIDVDLYVFPIKDPSGNIGQLAAILRDVSERKKSEQKMIERDEELKKMNEFMIGRELKMVELKEKIKHLEEQLAQSSPTR